VDTLFTPYRALFPTPISVPHSKQKEKRFAQTFETEKNVEPGVALAQIMAYFFHKKNAA
jgi:hypothetical protein